MTPSDGRATQERLRDAGLTVGVAESLTGGLLSAALTDPPGASAVFRGGLVVYATDLKHQLAGVSAELLAQVGAVHPEVALGLARGARRVLGSSIGIGVTGVAGPEGQDGQPVGTVFIAVAGRTERVVERHFAGDRHTIRVETVRAAMELLDRESRLYP